MKGFLTIGVNGLSTTSSKTSKVLSFYLLFSELTALIVFAYVYIPFTRQVLILKLTLLAFAISFPIFKTALLLVPGIVVFVNNYVYLFLHRNISLPSRKIYWLLRVIMTMFPTIFGLIFSLIPSHMCLTDPEFCICLFSFYALYTQYFLKLFLDSDASLDLTLSSTKRFTIFSLFLVLLIPFFFVVFIVSVTVRELYYTYVDYIGYPGYSHGLRDIFKWQDTGPLRQFIAQWPYWPSNLGLGYGITRIIGLFLLFFSIVSIYSIVIPIIISLFRTSKRNNPLKVFLAKLSNFKLSKSGVIVLIASVFLVQVLWFIVLIGNVIPVQGLWFIYLGFKSFNFIEEIIVGTFSALLFYSVLATFSLIIQLFLFTLLFSTHQHDLFKVVFPNSKLSYSDTVLILLSGVFLVQGLWFFYRILKAYKSKNRPPSPISSKSP